VVLRDRQILSEDGVIAVSVAVDGKGALVAGPEIASRGVIYVRESEALLDALRAAVIAALAEPVGDEPWNREAIATRLRTAVRQFINQRFQRRPIVFPMVLEV
jgi:ribonuclease J